MTLTEFGRKVEQNGGYGTEHGYGTAVLMAGGLVKKPEVFADWPGLESKNLFEKQDLNATIDARSVYCSAMSACFDIDFKTMKEQAFLVMICKTLQNVCLKSDKGGALLTSGIAALVGMTAVCFSALPSMAHRGDRHCQRTDGQV